jgi:DtxR family Mn-dependent transcriptional regulator
MPPRAAEDYLRTIQALDDDGVEVIQARIAERLGNKAPSVAQMLDRLASDGYVSRSGRLIHLTDRGRQVAAEVIRKHGLASRLLVDVLGIPDELARAEAGRWGRLMSDEVASRIAALLADTADHVPLQACADDRATAPALARRGEIHPGQVR